MGSPVPIWRSVCALALAIALAGGSVRAEEVQEIRGTGGDVDAEERVTVLAAGGPVTVRLHGVRMPREDQALGMEARRRVREMISGKPVVVKARAAAGAGVPAALIYLSDWTCVNERLIREGLAWWASWEESEGYWASAELEARTERRGIWSAPDPVPPWAEARKGRPTLKDLVGMYMALAPGERDELIEMLAEAEGAEPVPTPPASVIEQLEREIEREQARKAAPSVRPRATPNQDLVVVTETGRRYHRKGCRHALASSIGISRGEAQRRGFTPCRVCRP